MSPLQTPIAFIRPTLSALKELARDPATPRVSIALQLAPSPPESAQNATRLRHAIDQAKAELAGHEQGADIARALDKVEFDLTRFDGRPMGALILARPGTLVTFSLQKTPAAFVHVGRALRVRPVLEEIGRDDRFRVLSLSMKRVELFEGDAYGIRHIDVPGMPTSLEDALGFEVEREGPSIRSGGPNGRGVVSHGTGSRSDERQTDLERFHSVIVRALEKFANGGPPIVLAADRTHQGEFRRAFQHSALLAEGLDGNFDRVDDKDLHARAMAVARRSGLERGLRELGELEQLRGQGRTLDELTGIAAAAVAGRVRKLWMRRDASVPGLLDPEKLEVVQDGREELLDSIALRALMHGAEVTLVDAEHMPGSPATALLR